MVSFPQECIARMLDVLARMAAGATDQRLPISQKHDELDAIAFGINVLVGELQWTGRRMAEAERQATAELQRAKENAERANEAKGIFLRNISHEIRTPIAAMLAMAELLTSSRLTDQDRADLVDRLRANGRALLSLLGNVLDLSRLEAHHLELVPEVVSPLELVREIVQSLEANIRRNGIALSVDVEHDALLSIEIDRARLRQILVNLIDNAIKFTAHGVIQISLRAVPDESDALAIDVADTGIGIAEGQQAHLFEPFVQADASIGPAYGGTGLGLALSRRLAERLGGTLVLLRSTAGGGATFRLTVRGGHAGVSPAPALTAFNEPRADQTLEGLRVLLAEDNEDLQRAMGRLLTLLGASVDSAFDGHEAVSLVQSHSYDIVLMDVWMPRLDGLEATRLLRSRGCRVPIIALTADATTERRGAALDAGCDTYLSKPFESDDLIASIHALMRESRSRLDGSRLEPAS